ncbi:pseudouridylate synthase TRUB1 [Bombina bombina]|uniref:pseudouridylate synthase TRUB1 n=1 Tax=Bombina bombina TaxID=8345 RepID=UPI00235AA243|nr:pseudouridylate synthase TRUB1 [Bombina bombina]
MAGELAVRLQSLSGLFPVYKPKGPTSAQVLNDLKGRLLREAGLKEYGKKRKQTLKIGHGGTLDSSASGVLVVGIGDGTKMLGTMLTGSKKYTTVGELGKATDTLDASGTVTEEKPFEHITEGDLQRVLKNFTGDIMQVPPLFSALKKDGKRLSNLLREGAEVEAKPARPVTVYNLTVTDFQPPLFTLEIECGGGFYVRSLVNDIGKSLSSCASVKELIRTKQGPFTLDEHALRQEKWDIDTVAKVLQEYAALVPTESRVKRLKTEDNDKTSSAQD